MEEAGHVERGEADVGEDKQRPDGVEEHKVGAVRACVAVPAAVVVAIILADEICCQAELDDREDDSHDVGNGHKAESHFD